jgi:hypothetical protein
MGKMSTEVTEIVVEVVKNFKESWENGLDPANEYKTRGHRQRVKGFEPSHLIAAVLDPRSKHLPSFDDQTKASIHSMVKAEMNILRESELSDSTDNSDFAQPSRCSSTMAAIFDDSDSFESELYTRDTIDKELSRYLGMKKLPYYYKSLDGKELMNNPLEWWRILVADFPILAVMAKKYLCIPATSAPVERLFSRAGLPSTEKRNRLSEDVSADLIFLNANWDKLEFGTMKLDVDGVDNDEDNEITLVE